MFSKARYCSTFHSPHTWNQSAKVLAMTQDFSLNCQFMCGKSLCLPFNTLGFKEGQKKSDLITWSAAGPPIRRADIFQLLYCSQYVLRGKTVKQSQIGLDLTEYLSSFSSRIFFDSEGNASAWHLICFLSSLSIWQKE